ncbi:MAG TPA: hypothetical protein RMH99_20560, partial [Sandaracinaceae bacterium LLY-WYZ-13_1]|nr:hypothetical protein [Sandaracinaceae bacterium LLY-WYZ-13_1]
MRRRVRLPYNDMSMSDSGQPDGPSGWGDATDPQSGAGGGGEGDDFAATSLERPAFDFGSPGAAP